MTATPYVPNWRFRAWAMRRPPVDERSVDVARTFWVASRNGRVVAAATIRLGQPVRVGVRVALMAGAPAHLAHDLGF